MSALIVGNLDCESDFAALALSRGRRSLPQRVLRTISEAATSLRVLAEPGDRLWTPLPIALREVPPREVPGTSHDFEVPGTSWASPGLRFCSGPLEAESGEAVIAWGRTARIAELAESSSSLPGEESARPTELPDPVPSAPPRSLRDRLLTVPPVSPEVVAQVNHRALALHVARDLGCALPGARRIASLDDLRLHLQTGGAAAGAGNAWVVKAPWSAAGRRRYIAEASSDPAAVLDPLEVRAQIERLLSAQEELLFEPWMDRIDDWGCSLWIGPEAVEVLGPHRLLVDRRGRFKGIAAADRRTADGQSADSAPLHPTEFDTLLEVAREAAEALRRRGYRGPAGIDAWRYRTADGVHLHPLGEINARLTFGWVWRAGIDRAGRGPGRWPESG